jgi:peptidoglycan/LPS O-acetylase OafA/YrhL
MVAAGGSVKIRMAKASDSNPIPDARATNPGSEKLPAIPALTGLRFFAAAFILIEHAADWLGSFSNSDIRRYFIFLGIYGMPLFFVLSGFVIHYNYRRLFLSRSIARATCEFAAARFARLFPLYFCLLLVAIGADNLVAQVNGDRTLFAKILAYYVTLTQSWWYVVYANKLLINWFFSLSWSISTEMFFYAAFVAAVFVILLVRRASTAVVVAICYAFVAMGVLALSDHYLGPILTAGQRYIPNYIPPDRFNESFYRWLFYFSPYVRVFEFFMGCWAAHVVMLTRHLVVRSFERRLVSAGFAVVMIFLVLIGLQYLGLVNLGSVGAYFYHLDMNFLCAPALAFIMFYVARYDTRVSRMLATPSLIVLGDASYSIYLLHSWTLRLFIRPAPVFDLAWGLDTALRITCGIGLTLVTAYATYRLIEVPARTWLRRKLGALIGLVFGDHAGVAQTSAPAALEGRPTAGKWRLITLRRLGFASAITLLLVTVAFAGQAVQSATVWSKVRHFLFGPEIRIIAATYGMNCKNYPEPKPFRNTVSPGNATGGARRICDFEKRCRLQVSLGLAGDPANGCGKDFSVEYLCTGVPGIKRAYLLGEAFAKTVDLECDGAALAAK